MMYRDPEKKMMYRSLNSATGHSDVPVEDKNLSSASSEEESIFEMSSSVNTSRDVKILLYMCLAVDPTLRSTLEELKNSRFLNNLALCLPSVTW
ncbi:hypothetical protein D9C73_013456 [Collichthys lucidus]|uniref:Uncharacterized protein n=1 Tax=Collichthys lucidus TaxID=240159 RepID=A0A4U5UZS4_COLLU|nr:hypothetical protein D9C73_013456 [Collichthys lucidus]